MSYIKNPIYRTAAPLSIREQNNNNKIQEYVYKNRKTAVNIDSRLRDQNKYPNVNYFQLDFPRTFNNVSDMEISSLELPNTISVFTERNNKIRWSNQICYGFISEISISTDDPFTNNTPSVTSGARTDKFIKITVNGTCRDEIKAGDIIKIVGLYVNDGNSNTIYSGSGTNPHNIGLKNFHNTTSNTHSGVLESVNNSNRTLKIIPSHYFKKKDGSYDTWRKWTGDNSNGERDDYFNNWIIVLKSGNGLNTFRKVTAYNSSTRTITVEGNWDSGKEPVANDKYELLESCYIVYKGPNDTIASGKVAHNVFYIVDYKTTLSGNYSSCIGMWYHERDEYFNYSSKNITYRASIGSKARWWSETSKGFSKGLTDSMAEVKYSSNEGANFDCVINDNNEMITFNQYFKIHISKWSLFWKLNNVTLGGWMFSVKGDNRVSILYPSHGLFNGNILGIIRYPPNDTYNNWSSNNVDNGWPVSDLRKDLYGCAMIITDMNVSSWGEKNKFEIDQEIEIFNTKINILNGIHRIVDVPKNGYIINNRNSSPCFCFVVPIYINEDFPSNYKYSGSSSILETNYEGGWGMRLPIRASTGMSGVALELFNKNHTVVGKGMMKTTDSGVGATIDTSSTYENDLVIFKVSNVVGSTTAGGGGLGAYVKIETPFKFKFKNKIDDLGPILGLTNGNDRRDSSKWMRSLSNTFDLTKYTNVKLPSRISGDNYFYISINNLSEKGYTDNNSAVHDSNYSGHILSKVLITMGSGEVMFNTHMGGVVGGKSNAMIFDPPIKNLDKIEIGIYRKLSEQESFTDLEKYFRKTKQVHLIMNMNKIENVNILDIENGLQDQIIELLSKKDNIPHLLLGNGNDKLRNEKWQFEIASVKSESNSNEYNILMKIHSQRDIDFSRESSLDMPIDPSDMANYILENIPVNPGTHENLIYLKNITKITGLIEMPTPPKGFDYLDINNVDYSLSIGITEKI